MSEFLSIVQSRGRGLPRHLLVRRFYKREQLIRISKLSGRGLEEFFVTCFEKVFLYVYFYTRFSFLSRSFLPSSQDQVERKWKRLQLHLLSPDISELCGAWKRKWVN